MRLVRKDAVDPVENDRDDAQEPEEDAEREDTPWSGVVLGSRADVSEEVKSGGGEGAGEAREKCFHVDFPFCRWPLPRGNRGVGRLFRPRPSPFCDWPSYGGACGRRGL